jgi:DNA-binding response OmpR family regulator
MTQVKKKIILAEDDKYISRAYNDGLWDAGFEVQTVTDGDALLQKLKKEKPDIILLDVIMPGKNGFEVLEEMKMDTALKNIPVIIISNLGQQSDLEKGKALGAVDYLIKADFTMDEVIEKVKYHLAKK